MMTSSIGSRHGEGLLVSNGSNNNKKGNMRQFIVLYHNNFKNEGSRGDISAMLQTANSPLEAATLASEAPHVLRVIGVTQGTQGYRVMMVDQPIRPTFSINPESYLRIT